uniref:Centromere protein P n=1 Tax=Poecilia mexicana TaxID=48701 RepID=A0A3B3XMG7_9TELE
MLLQTEPYCCLEFARFGLLSCSDVNQFSRLSVKSHQHQLVPPLGWVRKTGWNLPGAANGDKSDLFTRAYRPNKKQEKFPSIVSLPEGCGSEVMTLNHPELPGCCFFIYWCVDVSTGGAVTPKIQLLSKIPEKALQLFPSQPAGGGAAEAFQSLLRILGTEAAIESIIRAVSLSESDELSN